MKYFLGLDIGTNSVGYAVTNTEYEVLKFHNKGMWGSHVFEEGQQAEDRRIFRTNARRMARKKQRVTLTRELFALEIAKIDPHFFDRLDNSELYEEDKPKFIKGSDTLFNDDLLTDKEYHSKFPTIHHLIMHLIKTNKKEDIRLIYLAVSYMIRNRGNFLIDVDKDDIDKVISFDSVFEKFKNYFDEYDLENKWDKENKGALEKVLNQKINITEKQKQIKFKVLNNLKLSKWENEIIKAIAGAKFTLSILFENESYNDLEYKSINLTSNDIDEKLPEIIKSLKEEEIELIMAMKAVYDWSLLAEILKGEKFISLGKIKIYNQHKEDLKYLKYLVKKYLSKDEYIEVFKIYKKGLHNYVSYIGNVKSIIKEKSDIKKDTLAKSSNEDFCKYLKNLFKDIKIKPGDEEKYNEFKTRLDINNEFMPKQITKENSVIPYQLFLYQLKTLLENNEKHHPFLSKKDKNGFSVIEKILSILEFRVPYYVGPLNDYHKKFTWIERKKGEIRPWNFENLVDLDKSEEAFIRRMTRKCTYLPGKDVVCKNSLLYSKFEVLNELNNLKINNEKITVDQKQKIYDEFFQKSNKKITKKKLAAYFNVEPDAISGVDININSSLRSYNHFKNLLLNGILNEAMVEKIIARISITTDKKRLIAYLESEFPSLNDEDRRFISNLNYTDYGRFSEEFLTEIYSDIEGCSMNLITALYETNYNLMELLSDNFGYKKQIDDYVDEYYSENPKTIDSMLDDMYIPNAVRRSIYRTIDVVKDIKNAQKTDPKRIFLEMARAKEKKPEKKQSRKENLKALLKNIDQEYQYLREELEKHDENELKREKLFLYYTQLGKCMYSGDNIDLSDLVGDTYDIDHIYPQSKVKDDSIHNNKVLVKGTENKKKDNKFPINKENQQKMLKHWEMLKTKGLITSEKLYRLTRTDGFSNNELTGFINRQLVETRQSTKALGKILQEMFPKSEIVYVKAGLVSEFRNEFDLLKSRLINDFHHAKDAYLNIVVGNVHHVKFTIDPRNFIKENRDYSLNIKSIKKDGQVIAKGFLAYNIERNNELAWDAKNSIEIVKKQMNLNNINYVRYSFKRKGQFFDINPINAEFGNNLVPRKKGLDSKKYGGYNKTTASIFTLVQYTEKNKTILAIKPIELLYVDKFIKDEKYAIEYCKANLGLENPKIIRKIIKVNTLLSLDGFLVNISKKDGNNLGCTSAISLILDSKSEQYVKRIESFLRKKIDNKELKINEKYHKISHEENMKLYDLLLEKSNLKLFQKLGVFTNLKCLMEKGKEKFWKLPLEDQVYTLSQLIYAFKTGRSGRCDLRGIGGKENSSQISISPIVSNYKFKSVKIIDQSPSGLLEKTTENLLKL